MARFDVPALSSWPSLMDEFRDEVLARLLELDQKRREEVVLRGGKRFIAREKRSSAWAKGVKATK